MNRLVSLIERGEVQMLGLIRQEVLSGIKDPTLYAAIRDSLRWYPDGVVTTAIHELAAEYFNRCRSKGIQGSHTDFLISACSTVWDMPVLSKDHDYEHYALWLPITIERETV
ncbi:MAG: PIN domain nuclease [Verrucomicrobiota bacterium]|nr:PIN domain nuclease [Verrucomicrobiota bacterium]